MSTTPQPAAGIPKPEEVLLPVGDDVTLDGLALPLLEYAVRLGYLHWLLFATPLLIARVYEVMHGVHSEPHAGKTIAFELDHLSPEDQFVFCTLVFYSAPANSCSVFDLRALPPGKRIAVEYNR